MGVTGEEADVSPVTTEKKSKKNMDTMTGQMDVGDGDGNSDGAIPKEDKGQKHRKKKKRKPESNEDGDDHQSDKGDLVNDGDVKKKGKNKKRKIDSLEEAQIEENEIGRNDGPEISMEDSRAEKADKNVKKKGKNKKRKIDSLEKAQIEENEIGRNDGPEISMEDCQAEKADKKKRKKMREKKREQKKKADAQNVNTVVDEIMTEEVTPETQDDTGYNKGSKEEKKTEGKDCKVTSKTTENDTEKSKAKGRSKRVSFSGHVEVFPSSDTGPNKQTTKGDGLVRGIRFTPEEDEIIKQAVLDYITARDLGEDGLQMILNCKSYKGMKKCWQEIATCIPYRPSTAVYYRAHILFERDEDRTWTPEQIEALREFHKKYGNKWKKLAEELGKHRFHVKDTWRRIKLADLKSGKWGQEEYQKLHDLVNLDIRMKLREEKKSKHGMLRDNHPWTAISERVSTRSDASCCTKWYNQLTSSLVAEKKWSDSDDYRMIGKLYELDAACADDVEWDELLDHRPGDICRKRWEQMVKHIGDYASKPFAEQVDVLAKRYSPELAETREAWDNKPVVP